MDNRRALNVSSWEYRYVTFICRNLVGLTRCLSRRKKKWEKAREQDNIDFEEMLLDQQKENS